MTPIIKIQKLFGFWRSVVLCLLMYLVGGESLWGNPNSLNPKYPVEGVLLHTDRDIYVTGEYLHLKTFLWTMPGWNGPSSEIVYYDLVSENRSVASGIMAIENFQTDANIYLHDTLSSGFYQLVAYTHWMRNSDLGNTFTKTIFLANRFDNDLKTIANHNLNNKADSVLDESENSFNHLKRVNTWIKIDAPDTLMKREQAKVSVSFPEMEIPLIGLSATVASEEAFFPLNFNSQSRAYYLKIWSESSVSEANFYMENDHYVLEGSIQSMESVSYDGTHVILTTPNDSLNLLLADSNADGKFQFALSPAYRGRNLYISTYPYNPGKKFNIQINNKFIPSYQFSWQDNGNIFIDRDYVRKSQNIVKARIAYRTDYWEEHDKALLNNELFPGIFSKPATTISLADYIPFDDLQDISREIIPAFRIRRNRDQSYRTRLVDESSGLVIDENPAFFIDGIYCHKIDPLLYLNSELLHRIEIQNRNWIHGNLAFPGIVALFSKGNEYLKLVNDLPLYKYKFNFFEKNRQFTPPVYSYNEPVKADQPDLRQLLFWEPEVEISNNQNVRISISTGDLSGSFLIQFIAMDATGNIFEGTKRFIVK